MIANVQLQNFGPLEELRWSGLSSINLVIGGNGAGKTMLLKALYSAVRTLEEYKRGAENRSASEVLVDKLYWTFQQDKIGSLVTKGAEGPLRCTVSFQDADHGAADFMYEFGKSTTKQINVIENHVRPRRENSIFLPAKEVLSLHQVILTSRERDRAFGFDDTYVDLARALQLPRTKGMNFKGFSASRRKLEAMFGGRVSYNAASQRWEFQKGKQSFQIGVTSEGTKKIGILDTLLGNRYLGPGSIVFFDEPESALHPEAISALLDIIELMAESGVQIILASHSYFVIKKLCLIAQQKQRSIPVLSLAADGMHTGDLKDGMPDNPIIDESIRLYEQAVDLALG
jgi:AAA15 family ATPase/GTPase